MTPEIFLEDTQGRRFSDVVNDSEHPFGDVLEFFSDHEKQRRMEESEVHHDRAPLAGVVRELESLPAVDRFLSKVHDHKSKRFRQAIGVLVRIIMEMRGWQKTGRKGSLGVRAARNDSKPNHNTGGLAFWFIRAERYERAEGMPYRKVRDRLQDLETEALPPPESGAQAVPPQPSESKTPHSDGTKSDSAITESAQEDQT